MSNFTEEQAIDFYDSEKWRSMSQLERAKFQINEPRLCMPFDVFQCAVEQSLGRPVFTHQFGVKEFVDYMRRELSQIPEVK